MLNEVMQEIVTAMKERFYNVEICGDNKLMVKDPVTDNEILVIIDVAS